MKNSILIALLFITANASAQSIVPGLVSTTNVGANGVGRQDAQVEAVNVNGQGHALISITQGRNPGDTSDEAALNYGAYDSTGVMRQMASISSVWVNNATVGNGFASLRFNVDTVAGQSDIFMRGFPYRGVTFFYDSETTTCGGRFICIKRTSGSPSIAGKDDLVLEGAASAGGGSGTIFLNAYSAGIVYIGGTMQLAKPSVACSVAGASRCVEIYVDGVLRKMPIF